MFLVVLVCLSVCQQDYSQSNKWIGMKLLGARCVSGQGTIGYLLIFYLDHAAEGLQFLTLKKI